MRGDRPIAHYLFLVTSMDMNISSSLGHHKLNSSCPTTSEMAKLEDFAHLMVLGLGLSVPWCDDCTHRSSNADCISDFLLGSRVRSLPLYRLSCLSKLSPSYVRQEAPPRNLASMGAPQEVTTASDSDDKSKLLDVVWESNEWLIYEMRD